jgi:hypothetical protein
MILKTYFSRSEKRFHFWRQIIFGVTEILQAREKKVVSEYFNTVFVRWLKANKALNSFPF